MKLGELSSRFCLLFYVENLNRLCCQFCKQLGMNSVPLCKFQVMNKQKMVVLTQDFWII